MQPKQSDLDKVVASLLVAIVIAGVLRAFGGSVMHACVLAELTCLMIVIIFLMLKEASTTAYAICFAVGCAAFFCVMQMQAGPGESACIATGATIASGWGSLLYSRAGGS